MRTIIVIFTERKLSLNEMVPYKRYKFLCNQVLCISRTKKMQSKQSRFWVKE